MRGKEFTLEALKGSPAAYHPLIHAARPHAGQGRVADRVRRLILRLERGAESDAGGEG